MNWKDNFWDYGGPGHMIVLFTTIFIFLAFIVIMHVHYHGWDSLFHGGW